MGMTLGMSKRTTMRGTGTTAIWAKGNGPIQWEKNFLILGDYMTSTEISGNGVRIGMRVSTRELSR